MKPDETRAIEHACARLVFSYANLSDSEDWTAVAALFAEDGRLSRPSAPDAWSEGRETILANFRTRAARIARHFCANVVISVIDDTTATGECALVLFMPNEHPRVGSFHDRFVKTERGWKFAERRGSLLF